MRSFPFRCHISFSRQSAASAIWKREEKYLGVKVLFCCMEINRNKEVSTLRIMFFCYYE